MLVPELSPFLILLELRMVRGGGDNWSTGCAKYQSNHHHQQTNIQLFTGHMPRVAVDCNPGQVVYTHASISKQYHLVPANGR